MTNLKNLRKASKKTLREVGIAAGVKPAAVHDAEMRGLQTTSAAKRYAKAFPGVPWQELLG